MCFRGDFLCLVINALHHTIGCNPDTRLQKEFEQILREDNIDAKLNELDDLAETDDKKSGPTPQPQ